MMAAGIYKDEATNSIGEEWSYLFIRSKSRVDDEDL